MNLKVPYSIEYYTLVVFDNKNQVYAGNIGAVSGLIIKDWPFIDVGRTYLKIVNIKAVSDNMYIMIYKDGKDFAKITDFTLNVSPQDVFLDPFTIKSSDIINSTTASTKCDCGSETVYGIGSNLHTDWCQKASHV